MTTAILRSIVCAGRAWIGAALLLAWSACVQPVGAVSTSVYSYANQNAFTYSASCTSECPFSANPGGGITIYIEFNFDTSGMSGEISPTGIAVLRDPWGLDLLALGSITVSHGTIIAWSFNAYGTANHLWSAVSTSDLGDNNNWMLEYFLPNDQPEYMTALGSAPTGTWSGPSVYADGVLQIPTPLPAGLPLFVGGLGLLLLQLARRDHAFTAPRCNRRTPFDPLQQEAA